MIHCDVGEYPKFLQQCLRWSRTTFRSNMCSLVTDRSVYRAQPWTVYALMISQMINFALFYDAALIWTLRRTDLSSPIALKGLCVWIWVSKLPKVLPYFWRQPSDLIYLPTYYIFAYFHSFIKLWALLTFWDTQWSGRNLDGINKAAADERPSRASNVLPAVEFGDFGNSSGRYTGPAPRTPAMRTSIPAKTSIRSNLRLVGTPWGFTASVNLHRTPANVLQNQQAGRSWPADSNMRKRQASRDQVYQGDHSAVVLQFEEDLASQTADPHPTSSVSAHQQIRATTSTNEYLQPTPLAPSRSPPPSQPLSTPNHAPKVPTRSFVRADQCERLHEGHYPRRRCRL